MRNSEMLKTVASWQGCSVETLREALKQGVIPYGTGFKPSGNERYIYLLYPAKVREHLGLDLGTAPFVQEKSE